MENSTTTTQSDVMMLKYNSLWITIYGILICATLAGNTLTIFAIILTKKLSSMVANQFIFSLAVSDLFVGLSTPCHMLFYIVESFNHNENICLIRYVILSFSCASSIINLTLIASDRYIAVVYPLKYHRFLTKKNSIIIISIGWFLSLTISTIPIYWNKWDIDGDICDITILPVKYFTFICTPLFSIIWLTMLIVYMKIWRETNQHAKRIRNTTNLTNCHTTINDTKSIQVVMLTLGCFSICWMPYFIITTYYRINGGNSSKFNLLYEIAFTMAVSNSGMNPIIYAWKNSNFRTAFWCLLRCQSPNEITKQTTFITNHIPNNKNHNNNNKQYDLEMISSKTNNKDSDDCECSHTTDTTTVPDSI